MINQDRQAKINKEQAKYQQGLDKEMAKYTYNLTNTSALMKQLKANDLNPTLALGNGAAGGQSVSTGNSGTQGVGMIDNKISFTEAMQMSLLDAQKKNIEADTKLKEADANKTSGVDTEVAGAALKNIIEQTENAKVLRAGYKLDNTLKNFPFISTNVQSFVFDNSGTLWIGCYGDGLFFSKDRLQTLHPYVSPVS